MQNSPKTIYAQYKFLFECLDFKNLKNPKRIKITPKKLSSPKT